MSDNERRKEEKPASALRGALNKEQLKTLEELEHFGWELKFVRRKPFQPGTPVVFDRDKKRFAVLNEDGTLNDKPDFEIRH